MSNYRSFFENGILIILTIIALVLIEADKSEFLTILGFGLAITIVAFLLFKTKKFNNNK